jgi:hypothetical protein
VPRVFLGSSAEGKDVAERLAARLDRDGSIETKVWTQGVFDIGTHALDSLIRQAAISDFAVLVLSPDDSVESRDTLSQAPRDNVIFELGLFIGALGGDRTYMVQPDGVDLKLPSDLAGITQARYNGKRSDGDLDSALNGPTLIIRDRIKALGIRHASSSAGPSKPAPAEAAASTPAPAEATADIESSLRTLENNLTPQGWNVRWNPAHTTFRVVSPSGKRSTLKMVNDSKMNEEFDRFIRELRSIGARVDSSLRNRPE